MQELAIWVMSALLSLPIYKEDREAHAEKTHQYESIAQGVASTSAGRPRPPREWAALLLTVGHHETGFSLRIHEGRCKPRECDAGRARGLFQMHANRYTRAAWDELVGLENTSVQTEVAAAQLARAYWICARSGVPWVQATLSAYAGRRCSDHWRGLDARLATYRRLVQRP